VTETAAEGSIEVLLVEDDEEDYILTSDVLSRIEGRRHVSHWARDYHSALEAIQQIEFDVCLVDYRLGAETGIELVRELLASGHDLPVVVLTGNGDRHVDLEAAQAGAADYLVKGEISPPLLERTIRYAMRSRATLQALRESEAGLRQSQRMDALGQLAGGVAHDFNNLLTVISGYTSLSRDVARDEELRGYLHEIAKAADRAADLTGQLLSFSRRRVLQPELVGIPDVVNDLVPMLRRLIETRVELVVHVAAEPPPVFIDRGRLEQVIINLVVNARDAIADAGTITIEASAVMLDDDYAATHIDARTGCHVMLAVSDTGVGMDESTQARIFEPFYTTKPVGSGTGLGLATVHGIVKQSGGNIWLYSEPGHGATFKIYLPASTSDRVEALQEADEGSSETPPAAVGATVLVLEDNEALQGLTTRILESAEYRVLVASTVDEGAEILRTQEIDLVLTDLVMPGGSGHNITGRPDIREIAPPVIYMSGYTEATANLREPGTKGFRFLEKPFTFDALLSAVESALVNRQET
jgi:signal transduction histidine kinase